MRWENHNDVKVTTTGFAGLLIIEPKVFEDSRGYFFESFNGKQFREAGIDIEFLQDNQSKSGKNVIRGLHFQLAPFAQAKLVRILQGTILDVAVDLRKGQPTFMKVFTMELSAQAKTQLLIPKGFAHGFSVLSDTTEILYKSDEYYHPECDRGIRYNDPDLAIDWKIERSAALVSEKDKKLPTIKEATFSF